MYINRTEQRSPIDSVTRKSIVSRKGKAEGFADTMASVIDIDVVEIGDPEDDRRKQQPKKQNPEQSEQNAQQEKPSLDIKA